MAQPPATPAASRFRLSKRRPVQRHNGAPSSSVFTPRFAPPSSAKTGSHQPPAFSIPALARPRTLPTTAPEDAIDSSPDSAGTSSVPTDEAEPRADLGVESSLVPESPTGIIEPPSKRRRVSITPDFAESPGQGCLAATEILALPEAIEVHEFEQEDQGSQREGSSDEGLLSEDDQTGTVSGTVAASKGAPTRPLAFVRPPRFRTLGAGGVASQLRPLPDAFSPRKPGAKYVPGGLAAELRDWLMGVRDSDEDAKLGDSEVEMRLDGVRPGANVWIVHGRRLSDMLMPEHDEHDKILLAGTGRMSDLVNPSHIVPGVTTVIAPPMWEAELVGLGSWAVACDWHATGMHADYHRGGA